MNRRRFERFAVEPSYSSIALRTLDRTSYVWSGHAFDLSEGGIRFEMDRGIDPGTPVAMRIDLPHWVSGLDLAGVPEGVAGHWASIYLHGNIVWANDDEPGPVQMAMAISRFCRAGDRDRLLRLFARGRNSLRAA